MTESPRIHSEPRHQQHYDPIIEDVDKSHAYSDGNGDDVPHDPHSPVLVSWGQESSPRVLRTQIRTSHRPSPQPVERSASQRKAITNQSTVRGLSPVSTSDYVLPQGRPTIQRCQSCYGQPLIPANRNSHPFMPGQSLYGTHVPIIGERVPAVRERAPIPGNTIDLSYPNDQLSYTPAPTMPSRSSPGFYPVVDVSYRGPRAGLSDILDDINRVNVLLYEDIAKRNIFATREREEEQNVAKNITAPKTREDKMTPDEMMPNEESAKFILQRVEQGFDEIMLLINGKIQQELGTHRLTDTASSSSKTRRERKKYKRLHTTREEAVSHIAETLAAGLARAAHGGGFRSTYRRLGWDPESSHYESESGDAMDMPHRHMRVRACHQSRGQPLRRNIEKFHRKVGVSSQYKVPTKRRAADISTRI
ncbi:hypothetical protein M434DRAFT_15981 [Hypoxylon sp. CO27-5]|nr:hypothetical protein M434DRAFT_15981 [Hypoxylon sp. CO27-5]